LRLHYARDNMKRDWNHVFFCDETSFYACARKHGVRRTAQEEFVPVTTVKHPPKINTWAGISARGKGKLFLFKENLDAALRKRVITDYMVPSLYAPNGGRRNHLVVQQCSNLKHNAKVCVAAMGRAPTRLLQSPQSPGPNPLENAWKIMKDRVAAHRSRTVAELQR